ncbi:FAD-dependent oxidoreductase [Paenibacillus soyae]|uniref:FAD-binding protein n=1 Tax=Paenibacillus soyae TaxID=2969249 RepID=A0A9X2S915_9BACL|nr:FAD-binding protein [Paenibacillus soyae]MCR2804680.1 FAD-binding protein [Paenibacillus soyae]
MGEIDVKLTADVLVIGGGPAAAWAAWSAASNGANVALVDKGYLGTSGATAPGGTNLLYLPPDQKLRDQAVEQRFKGGGFLSEPSWTYRVLDQVYINLERIEKWGYPFVRDEEGVPQRGHLQGLEYMNLMRKVVLKAGVKVLDHHPSLELLVDEHGVGGARGVSRLDNKEWEVRANAVVLATGGCAFLSKGLGCNVLTGDGLLMASELGAELSGMEFSRAYAPSAAFGTITRGRLLGWATYYDEEGNVLNSDGNRGQILHRAVSEGRTVYAMLNKADTPEKQAILRSSHAVFFLPYDRTGIDPFTQKFPLTLRAEGTVRGTGGIRLVSEDCSTTVAGLYAAGDAASRERLMGGMSGGGAFNASWAICSGTWSGEAAAAYALAQSRNAGSRDLRPAGRYGLQAGETSGSVAVGAPASDSSRPSQKELVAAVQQEVSLKINYFRNVPSLQGSLARLNALWPIAGSFSERGGIQQRVRSREIAAMAATARWMHTASLERKETRAMHALAEYPEQDPNQLHRITLSGIDEIAVRYDKVPGSSA